MPLRPSNTPVTFLKYDLVIFDLDGTLYDQKILRRKLLFALVENLIRGKISVHQLRIIKEFRKQRELHKSYTSRQLNSEQYQWVADYLKIDIRMVEQVIGQWMYKFPLTELYDCRYPGIQDFFRELRRNRKLLAIYSDFPPEEKMYRLELEADSYHCSTDADINQLKPSARALEIITAKYKIPKENTIFIGDREDTDGESARLAHIDFLKVDREKAVSGELFNEWTKCINS